MAIARVEEFITKLTPLTTVKDIKALCNQELDYLRHELSIVTTYSDEGYPKSFTSQKLEVTLDNNLNAGNPRNGFVSQNRCAFLPLPQGRGFKE